MSLLALVGRSRHKSKHLATHWSGAPWIKLCLLCLLEEFRGGWIQSVVWRQADLQRLVGQDLQVAHIAVTCACHACFALVSTVFQTLELLLNHSLEVRIRPTMD